ncbi:ABC transporter permease [Brevibacterium sp. SMBL_HHYL_HB1]|jgi:ABC-2 type transport system permease protein|uniref:ABC transporter permease n=1 Tax=Brevibacterium sp. SMBL_HHYL_HB1 TaxID=2777556 RepID=UPI001BA542EC|nr:ABC transporter permease [Brevibacterium sp. SMBL_HHYL_HB1]QUL80409.1 ABC transporter permease [Brevibacterium sp. SMBL_HHYL_HB1]HJA61309.1 ABC transporter permease [Candidatus Brevibacterium intestinavium]
MRLRRIVSQTKFETVSVLRNGEQLLLSIIFPLGLLIFLAETPLLAGLDIIDSTADPLNIAVAGALSLSLASSAFTGQAIATAFDRRYGVLRQLATTPLGTNGLILGKLGAVIAVVVIQFALVFAVAVCLGFRGPVDVLGLVLATVFGTACLLSLGLLMAGTLRAEATLAATNLIWVLMAGVGGLVVAHPGEWGTVVSYLPSGALGDVMRSAIGVGGIDIKAIIVLLIWGLVGTLAARRWFRFE